MSACFGTDISAWYSSDNSETERDWDKELAEDVKGECEEKYGKVDFIKVEKESQVCAQPTFHHSILKAL